MTRTTSIAAGSRRHSGIQRQGRTTRRSHGRVSASLPRHCNASIARRTIDSWVASEYAKVRWLYTQLGLADRTEIEYFNVPEQASGLARS
jgi:hypothetical protein